MQGLLIGEAVSFGKDTGLFSLLVVTAELPQSRTASLGNGQNDPGWALSSFGAH